MGGVLSKASGRNGSNRVSSSDEIHRNEHSEDGSGMQDIKVPDATTKYKKSKSMRPFKRPMSFMSMRKTSSLQSAVKLPKVTIAEAETLQKQKVELETRMNEMLVKHNENTKQLNDELTRLKSEVRALNNTLRKVRTDKDKALLKEKNTMERAITLEQEKDKIQRQFKIFREAKEVEVITILKEKQHLLNQLRHIGQDGSMQDFIMESSDLRHAQSINEWLMDGHSGSESYIGQHGEEGKLKHPMLGDDHRLRKDICMALQSLLQSLHHARFGVPRNNVYSVYITSTKELKAIAEQVMTGCRKLMLQLEAEGRLLTLSYFLALSASHLDKSEEKARLNILMKADVVIVFIDKYNMSDAIMDVIWTAINHQKICLVASLSHISSENLHFLGDGLRSSPKVRTVHGGRDEQKLVFFCIEELANICTTFHDKQSQQHSFKNMSSKNDYNEIFFHSYDTTGAEEQLAFETSSQSTQNDFAASFLHEFNVLNTYITQDGPTMPMLVASPSGSGKSSLLSHWITSINNYLPNSCILYHTVSIHSAYSKDAVHIIRRFMYVLLDELPVLFNLQDIAKDFPRWLERACSKYRNGVVIVIDGADLIVNKEYFNWLLDPLPVPVRVVVSVSSSNHPKQWDTWTKLQLVCDREKTIQQCNVMLKSHHIGKCSEELILTMLHNEDSLDRLSNHLYRRLVFVILSFMMSENETIEMSNKLLTCENVAAIFLIVVEVLETRHPRILVKSVLSFLYLSSNGLSLMELQELHGDPDLFTLLDDLHEACIVTDVCGLFKIVHDKGKEAIAIRYKLEVAQNNSVNGLRTNLAQTFQNKITGDCVSYRIADELPELLISLRHHEELAACMKSIYIFIHLYRRGKHSCIVNYWKLLGVDFVGIHEAYMGELQQLTKSSSELDIQLTMLYDLVGDFFKDLDQYKLAQLAYEKSLELKETHVDAEDVALQQSYFCLGKLFTKWKKYQTAEDYLKQALEVKDTAVPIGSGNDNQQRSLTYASILESFAALYMMQDKVKEADLCRKNAMNIRHSNFVQQGMVHITNALTECKESLHQLMHGENAASEENIVSWLISASHIHFNLKNYQEASDSLQLVLQYLQKDVEHEQDHQAVAHVMVKLSFIYTEMGQNDKAEGTLEKALSIYFNANILEETKLNVVINSLVKLYKSQKRMDSLERLYRLHYEALEKAYGPDDVRVADIMNSLGVHLIRTGKTDESFALFERAMQIYIEHVGLQDVKVSVVLGNLAKMFYEQRDVDRAAHYYKLSMASNRMLDQLKFMTL